MGIDLYKPKVLKLSLEGFDGPIDLLLSLVKDQKIDITKIQILPLAEQYLIFLKKVVKEDIELAAEYLVMGAILTYIKSKLLLPIEEDEIDNPEKLSQILKFQILKLETFQKLAKNLFLRRRLGKDFFSKGVDEIFSKKVKFKYDINLYDLTKVYSNILLKDEKEVITIAYSNLYTVEKAIENIKKNLTKIQKWKNIMSLIPNDIKNYLELKSVIASYFVASLELSKDGKIFIKQNNDDKNFNLQIIKNN